MAAGDLLRGSQRGEKSALGREVGRWGGVPGQARGRYLKRASCFGRWWEQRRGRRGRAGALALGTWAAGLGGGFGVAAAGWAYAREALAVAGGGGGGRRQVGSGGGDLLGVVGLSLDAQNM